MTIRTATPDDLLSVMRVLEGALLDVATDAVRERIREGDVLVYEDGRIEGALVLSGSRIVAVAVRRARRREGIGSALVEAAADRRGDLLAEFDAPVRGFYEALGFAVEPLDGDRFRGRLPAGSDQRLD